jgi:hypothetical protein
VLWERIGMSPQEIARAKTLQIIDTTFGTSPPDTPAPDAAAHRGRDGRDRAVPADHRRLPRAARPLARGAAAIAADWTRLVDLADLDASHPSWDAAPPRR